jgi:hypothetical protein
MDLFSLLELIVLLLILALLVYEYAAKDVALYVKILVYVSWLLSFGFLFIVPLDVYVVKKIKNKKI